MFQEETRRSSFLPLRSCRLFQQRTALVRRQWISFSFAYKSTNAGGNSCSFFVNERLFCSVRARLWEEMTERFVSDDKKKNHYSRMKITQTSILFTNSLTEINGQWSKNTKVGFWPVSTEVERYSAGYISNFGTGINHTPGEGITAKCPEQSEAKLSSNCLSNAHKSNAGMAGSISAKSISTPLARI